jgi:hypothetical protein
LGGLSIGNSRSSLTPSALVAAITVPRFHGLFRLARSILFQRPTDIIALFDPAPSVAPDESAIALVRRNPRSFS